MWFCFRCDNCGKQTEVDGRAGHPPKPETCACGETPRRNWQGESVGPTVAGIAKWPRYSLAFGVPPYKQKEYLKRHPEHAGRFDDPRGRGRFRFDSRKDQRAVLKASNFHDHDDY